MILTHASFQAAPGSWSLYASKKVGEGGTVIAIDLAPISNVAEFTNNCQFECIQGDFRDNDVKQSILTLLEGQANLIISDMAPNFTGDKRTDALRTMALCEEALRFAVGESCLPETCNQNPSWRERGVLCPGGSFLCKFFSCGKNNESDLMGAATRHFQSLNIFKPPASRIQSAEKYLLASGFRGGEAYRN